MKNKLLSIFALALLPASLAVPQSANAAPTCVGSECEVTFLFTGGVQTFAPPENATNLRFEVFGAVGGGNGGGGGMVTGTLTQIPGTLYIYVGGAGDIGSLIPGGFNGGGAAGGDAGNEGSGGGASDIRISQAAESRIVVAGGGGGGGGKAGGAGGNGGNQNAAHGASGQATGGGGATQSSGGFAGISNGGYQQAGAGALGIGGAGASSTHAGGGGGGGGYFGGGGGGADDNTCCSDGGGGGGGSSYADTQFTSNVAYMAGVSWGHGWVTLKYTLAPNITYLEVIQATKSRLSFSIEGSESLSTLSQDELSVSGPGCFISYFTTDGILGFGSIHGCETGEVAITVRANSFGKTLLGPTKDVLASTHFDATAPSFTFHSEPIATSLSEVVIPFSLDEASLSADYFEVQGCEAIAIVGSQILLTGCVEGEGLLTLKALTLKDIWQNSSPAQAVTFSFMVDQTGPDGTWSEIEFSGDGPFSYSTAIDFGEPVTFSDYALDLDSTSSCEEQQEVTQSGIAVRASCSYADLTWTFTGNVLDALGNQTSFDKLAVSFSNPAPAIPPVAEEPVAQSTPEIISPPVESQPVPVTIPAAPGPIPAPVVEEPVIPTPPASESQAVIVISESPEVEPEPLEDLTLTVEATAPAEQVEIEYELEPQASEQLEEQPAEPVGTGPDVVETEPPILAEPVLAEAIYEDDALTTKVFPWLPLLLAIGLGVLGFGAWRFSGR